MARERLVNSLRFVISITYSVVLVAAVAELLSHESRRIRGLVMISFLTADRRSVHRMAKSATNYLYDTVSDADKCRAIEILIVTFNQSIKNRS